MIKEGIPMREKDMGDLFFIVMLVRRGKDHPDLPAANYTFKTYYLDSIEKFDKCKDEIITCCVTFGLRAYVSVNVKSKEEYSKMCSMKFAQNVLNNEYKKPWRVGDHVFGKMTAKNDNTWLVDVDNIDVNNKEDMNYVDDMISIINTCDSKYNPVVIEQIQTKSGFHILARPFNMQQYRNEWNKQLNFLTDREFPDVKKNHITLLYENL